MIPSALAPFGHGVASLAGRTVLQIIPRLDAGGAERTAVDIAQALVEVGARALVASEGGRMASELQAVGGVLIPFPAASKNPLAMIFNARRLARILFRERVDLVHALPPGSRWGRVASPSDRSSPPITAPTAGDRRSSCATIR